MTATGWKAGWSSWDKVSKAEFDTHVSEGHFLFGPELDRTSEAPDRMAYGILNDGRKVRAWVRGMDRDAN